MGENRIDSFDPLAETVLTDPYPHYRRLRDQDPIHWGEGNCWYVTRYADVVALLKDPRFGREIEQVVPERAPAHVDVAAQRILREWMVLRDPPYHTYLRSLVQRSFTPQMIAGWLPRMTEIARRLLNEASTQGTFDLLHDVAKRFPVIVVAEMLGVPPEDAPRFTPWTEALAAVIEFEQTPASRARGSTAMRALEDYLSMIIVARRRQPQDDLISGLLALEVERPIADETLIGTCTQLLFGGNDPVAHLIGNGLLALVQHPDALATVQTMPAVSEDAVDELMRYDSSVQMTFRYAMEDIRLHDKVVRQGDLVAIVMGAANRDERHFAHADELDLARRPNQHLSLGIGIHYCMGAALARMEGRILLTELLRDLPAWNIDIDHLTWQRTAAVRGLKRLPIIMN